MPRGKSHINTRGVAEEEFEMFGFDVLYIVHFIQLINMHLT